MSPINVKFLQHSGYRVNRRHGTDRRTDGRTGATLYHPDTSVFWPLGGTAITRARAAGASRCAKTAAFNACYFGDISTLIAQIWEIPCSRKNHCISVKHPFTKWHKCPPRAICSQCWVTPVKNFERKNFSDNHYFGNHAIGYVEYYWYVKLGWNVADRFWAVCKTKLLWTRKPCCRKETARCCKCSFPLKFANNIHYKYKKE